MNTKVKKEEGEGLLPVLDQRFSCSSWKRPQQSKCFPAATGEEQMSTLQTRRIHPRAAGYSPKEQQPLDSSCWSRFSQQEQQTVGRALTGARERCEEEGTAKKCFGPTVTPIPNLPAKLSARGRRTSQEGRSEAETGERGGGSQGRWFSVCFSLSNSILTNKNNSHFFHSQDSLASDGNW